MSALDSSITSLTAQTRLVKKPIEDYDVKDVLQRKAIKTFKNTYSNRFAKKLNKVSTIRVRNPYIDSLD